MKIMSEIELKRGQKLILLFFLILFYAANLNSSDKGIPTPKEILGFSIGEDYKLASYAEAIKYLQILEKSSHKIKLFVAGKTSMNKDMYYAVISAEENIKRLDEYAEISKKLSIGKGINEEEAKELARTGKVIVYIDGGLHATECAPAQHIIELAYYLVSSEDKKVEEILKNVILLLFFPNPDGMDMVAEWYKKNVGTPYEVSPLPWLYHKYVGHDNNRDYFMANQIETRNIISLINHKWYPEIVYNHHQTAPFPARIWIPPNSEPTNPNIHPLILRWQNLIGTYMGMVFEKEKKEGAISRIYFDSWYPGYLTQIMDSHNIISILTETALYEYATPYFYTIKDFPKAYQDLTISAFYPSPWKGGWWRLKDAIDYSMTASLAVLEFASKFRYDLLYGKYKIANSVIQLFSNEPPYAFIIPKKQWDISSLYTLLDRLLLQGIEINQATEDFIVDNIKHPAGTYIVFMNQAFAYFVKNVFEIQQYPDLRKYPELWQSITDPKEFKGAPLRPYDVTGWTLPLQMGLKVISASSKFSVPSKQINSLPIPSIKIEENASAYAIDRKSNDSYKLINRLIKSKVNVEYLVDEFSFGSKKLTAGTFIIYKKDLKKSLLEKLAQGLNVEIYGIKEFKNLRSKKLLIGRIALYKSWVPNIDEGWTRWLLEQYEFPYTNVYDAEIKAGNLKSNYDVIIIPPQSTEEIINGHKKGTMPPEYCGGIQQEGIDNIKRFIREGGKVVAIDQASNFAIERLGAPAVNILKNVKAKDFLCSGSILKMKLNSKHPISYGMLDDISAFFADSPAFLILPTGEEEAQSIAYYPDEPLLLSGFIQGEKLLYGKTSVIEAKIGKGKIVLLGFNINNRGQSTSTFKLLFNSLYD